MCEIKARIPANKKNVCLEFHFGRRLALQIITAGDSWAEEAAVYSGQTGSAATKHHFHDFVL